MMQNSTKNFALTPSISEANLDILPEKTSQQVVTENKDVTQLKKTK